MSNRKLKAPLLIVPLAVLGLASILAVRSLPEVNEIHTSSSTDPAKISQPLDRPDFPSRQMNPGMSPTPPAFEIVPTGGTLASETATRVAKTGGLEKHAQGFTYRSAKYNVTFGFDDVDFVLPLSKSAGSAPALRYRLNQIAIGSSVLTRGASVQPTQSQEGVLEYRRDSVIERYTFKDDTLEQDFVINSLPSESGDLRVVGTITTDLTLPEAGSKGNRITFGQSNHEQIVVSDAVAIDATGKRLPLDMTWEGNRLAITVPASWLKEASLPIVVDPLIGGATVISPLTGSGVDLGVAYCSTQNEWLVVWQRFVAAGNYAIYGQRLNSTAGLVGSQLTLHTTTAVNFRPQVAYASGPNKYLVVWEQSGGGALGGSSVVGRLLNPDGTVVAAPFTIQDTAASDRSPKVTTDGTSWLVTTMSQTSGTQTTTIQGFAISGTGVIGSPIALDSGPLSQVGLSAVGYAGGTYMVLTNSVGGLSVTPINAATYAVGTRLVVSPVPSGGFISGQLDSSGSSNFLVTWDEGNTTYLKGRVITAAPGFATSEFFVATGLPQNPRSSWSAYSAPSGLWYVDYRKTPQPGPVPSDVLFGKTVSPTGSVGGTVDSIGTAFDLGAGYQPMALNTATNEMLVVYMDYANIFGQRVSLPVTLPAAPVQLTARSLNASTELTWSGPPNATSYKIYRSTVSGSYSPTPTATTATVPFTDAGPLTNGTTYYYVVKSSNIAGDSSTTSNEFSIIPLAPPSSLNATLTGSPPSVSLSWTAGAGATGYLIMRAPFAGTDYTEVVGTATGTTFVDSNVMPGQLYGYQVVGTKAESQSLPSNEATITVTSAPAPTALFVVNNLTLPAADAALRDRLQMLGFVLTIRTASAVLHTEADGKKLVVISSTASASQVGTKFRTKAVPAIVMQSGSFASNMMGMTGGTTSGTHYGTATGQTTVNIVNSTHPLAGGLTSGNKTMSGSNTYAWGKPSLSAGAQPIEIAKLITGDIQRVAVFAYEAGTTMVGLSAPARRVGFFLAATNPTGLNANYWTLFDAAVNWSTNGPSSPVAVSVQFEATKAHLSWFSPSPSNSFTILRATSATGPWTLVATVTGSTYTNIGLTTGQTYYFRVVAANSQGASLPSVVITGATATTTAIVDVIGPHYLRTKPSAGAPIDDWNKGTYSLSVAKSVNDVLSVVADSGIASVSWVADYGGDKVTLTPAPAPSLTCEITATAVAPGPFLVTVRCDLNLVGGGFGSRSFALFLDYRREIKVVWHFPGDQPGRTQRPGTANCWVPDGMTTPPYDARYTARANYVNPIVDQVNEYWKKGKIKFSSYIDERLMPPSGVQGDGKFVVHQNNNPTAEARKLPAKYTTPLPVQDWETYVNVYFFKQVARRSSSGAIGEISASTYYTPRTTTSGKIVRICVSDEPDGTVDTIAHELGHALDLLDVWVPADPAPFSNPLTVNIEHHLGKSILSNVRRSKEFSVPVWPANVLLMRQFGLGRMAGYEYLTDKHVDWAHFTSRMWNLLYVED